MKVTFEPLESGTGIETIDPIERKRYALETAEPVTPEPADTAAVSPPIDEAVRIRTSAITCPTAIALIVRDEDETMLAEAEQFETKEFPEGTYLLDLNTSIKFYLLAEGPLAVRKDLERTYIEFEEETDVIVGARSMHTRPATTVTTTGDPEDVMAAISTFGSALKSTGVDRSYPTLRGHPPTIALGEELSIPDGLEVPETGIRIVLPPEYEYVYAGASVAYYLGAEMIPGDVPKIVTDHGFEHELDTHRGVEREFERVLKQTFFMDCVTRTEGFYQVDLHEREAIEDEVDLDFADLFDRSLAEQLEAYLEVPYDVVEEHVPDWKLTTHVAPTPTSVETLPFVVDDLAVVRTPQTETATQSVVQESAVGDFLRSSSARSTSESSSTEMEFVQPAKTDSLEEVWIGDKTPLGVSKATPEAYRNRLDRKPKTDSIEITVVCNDEEMVEEGGIVEDVYGSRKELPFDVSLHYQLTRDELASVLESERDWLHYIGHIDEGGFECPDGQFDVETLDSVGIDAFLLNACQSYDQGMHLIEAGAIGGIVTLSDVINSGAVEMGSTIARLLNAGFPLRAALEIAKDENVIGNKYIVVGDGGLSIAQAKSGVPHLSKISRTEDGIQMTIQTFAAESDMGSLFSPHISWSNRYYISSGEISNFVLTEDDLEDFLSLENIPVLIDGQLRWSESINLETV